MADLRAQPSCLTAERCCGVSAALVVIVAAMPLNGAALQALPQSAETLRV